MPSFLSLCALILEFDFFLARILLRLSLQARLPIASRPTVLDRSKEGQGKKLVPGVKEDIWKYG